MSSFDPPRYDATRGAHRVDYRFALARTPIYVVGPPTESPEQIQARIDCGFGWVMARYDEILDFAADELLPLKNESWLDDGDSPVTREDFRNRLLLRWVTLHEDGHLTIVFRDGDLFAGHDVSIETDSGLVPRVADLEG